MRTYVGWKELVNTGAPVPYQQGKLVIFKVISVKAEKGELSGRYVWAKGKGRNTGHNKYRERL